MKPSDFGLPHKELREHQGESIQWCLDLDGVGIMEVDTGGGKTACPAAVASCKSVIALCQTKNLQQTNYGDIYSFTVLFGRSNYDCVHPENAGQSCAECLFVDEGMHKCPYSRGCLYLIQKALARASPKTSLNYHYYLSSRWPKIDPPTVLFLDEAHSLDKVVLEWSGCNITKKQQLDRKLPPFPTIDPAEQFLLLKQTASPVDKARLWLVDASTTLQSHIRDLKRTANLDSLKLKQMTRCEQLLYKLNTTRITLAHCDEAWYISSGPTALTFGRERRPGFIVKPLTAKYHFGRCFLHSQTTVAMSATIGSPADFVAELGIADYKWRQVPSRFPPESRQIHILDVPSMSSKATHADFRRQANEIAKVIKNCNPSWSGLIHVTRKTEARLLADRLARLGLQDRVWVMPGYDGNYVATNEQVTAWHNRLRRVPNSLCLSWILGTGYDGTSERICIVAKVQYPIYGSPGSYEAAWRSYSRSRYAAVAAKRLAQACGRTRRGREQDYDLDGQINGYVAIADGSWSRIKGKLPQGILDSIVVD